MADSACHNVIAKPHNVLKYCFSTKISINCFKKQHSTSVVKLKVTVREWHIYLSFLFDTSNFSVLPSPRAPQPRSECALGVLSDPGTYLGKTVGILYHPFVQVRFPLQLSL